MNADFTLAKGRGPPGITTTRSPLLRHRHAAVVDWEVSVYNPFHLPAASPPHDRRETVLSHEPPFLLVPAGPAARDAPRRGPVPGGRHCLFLRRRPAVPRAVLRRLSRPGEAQGEAQPEAVRDSRAGPRRPEGVGRGPQPGSR